MVEVKDTSVVDAVEETDAAGDGVLDFGSDSKGGSCRRWNGCPSDRGSVDYFNVYIYIS